MEDQEESETNKNRVPSQKEKDQPEKEEGK
jgi:hypothetical protein